MDFINSLPDGWTIWVWLIAGGCIIAAAIYGIYWAAKNDQFDEDIKYLVFDEDDEKKMSKEDFQKSQEVMKEQMESRERFLKQKDEKANS